MQPHSSLSYLWNFKLNFLIAVLLAAFLGLCAVSIVSSTAQSRQKEERELDDTIPKHLPIKVKVKNLNNENWTRDLEIEVENRSDKPIYYLGLTVILPDVLTEHNHKLGFPLQYGRGNLIDYNAPLQPDDVPIKPGESYTFKIPKHLHQEWERFATKRALPKNKPKKVQLIFKSLNFGDGTGFGTTGGVPVDIHQKQAVNSCTGGEKQEAKIASVPSWPPNRSSDSRFKLSTHFLPVSFSPVKLSIANASIPASSTSLARPDVCCPGTICSRLKLRKVNCCEEIDKAFSAACSEGGSFCAILGETTDVFCTGGGGTYCEEDSLIPLCSTSTPTPTPAPNPTPTPSPTPTQECDPATRPNNTNCYCETNFPPAPFWNCLCLGDSEAANYKISGYVNGCPSGTYNDGRDCCFQIAPTPTPTPVAGGCTTPQWADGSCPDPLYPNNGMCCSGGVDCTNTAARASLDDVSPSLPTSLHSDDPATAFRRNGGGDDEKVS